jgi:prepilin-type N-terminal cleavage/methylation domain-containing protein
MKMKKGFTLIELLVVIAIIGILSTIAVIALQSARTKSRDAKRIADIKQVQTALEMCFSDSACASGGYPVLGGAGAGADLSGITAVGTMATYMSAAPTAPSPADGGCSIDNNSYTYQSVNSVGKGACTSGTCANYKLEFCLGSATGDMLAGLHCATPTGISNSGTVSNACTWGT